MPCFATYVENQAVLSVLSMIQQPANRMFGGEVSEAGCRIDLGCVTSHNLAQNT